MNGCPTAWMARCRAAMSRWTSYPRKHRRPEVNRQPRELKGALFLNDVSEGDAQLIAGFPNTNVGKETGAIEAAYIPIDGSGGVSVADSSLDVSADLIFSEEAWRRVRDVDGGHGVGLCR